MNIEITGKMHMTFTAPEVLSALYAIYGDRFKGHAPPDDAHLHTYLPMISTSRCRGQRVDVSWESPVEDLED